MYKYVLNLVIKISLMFAQYFEYYAIILRGAVFLWTQCSYGVRCPLISRSVHSTLKHQCAAVTTCATVVDPKLDSLHSNPCDLKSRSYPR